MFLKSALQPHGKLMEWDIVNPSQPKAVAIQCTVLFQGGGDSRNDWKLNTYEYSGRAITPHDTTSMW